MPYIAVDLDALNVVPHVATACHVEPERITHGLVSLWAYCFRECTDRITRVHLLGFFGMEAADALSAFGFLEPDGQVFRVRGADRYLRLKEARSQAGKQRARAGARDSSGKLRAGDDASKTPAHAGDDTSEKPALTPSTEHRTPNTESKSLPPRVRAREGEPGELLDRIRATFSELRAGAEYVPTFQDEQAMGDLLRKAQGSEDEIARRHRLMLQRTRFPTGSSLVDLNRHWNAYAAPEPQAAAPPKSAAAPAPVSDWSNEIEGYRELG